MDRIVAVVALVLVGACDWPWPLDNPQDPRRCEPACAEAERCLEGRCQPWGPRPDAATPPDLALPDHRIPDLTLPADRRVGELGPDQGGPRCGNGVAEGTEACDGSDIRQNTCAGNPVTPSGGTPFCLPDCTLEWGACYALTHPSPGQLVSAAAQTASEPAVAGDGKGAYLVVWTRGTAATGRRVMGRRYDGNGKATDAAPFRVCTVESDQSQPTVSASGGDFLVVWIDDRNVAGGGNRALFGTRVDLTGAPGQPKGVQLSSGTAVPDTPSATFGGASYHLIVWSDSRPAALAGGGPDIYAVLVEAYSSSAPARWDTEIAVSAAPGHQTRPQAVLGAYVYLAVWEDTRNATASAPAHDLYGSTISYVTVKPQQPAGVALVKGSAVDRFPHVTTIKDKFLLSWARELSTGGAAETREIRGTLVDKTPAVTLKAPVLLAAGDRIQPGIGVAASAALHQLAWAVHPKGSAPGIHMVRVTRDALVATSPAIRPHLAGSPYVQLAPALAWSGLATMAVWQSDHSGGTTRIYGTVVQ